MDKIIIIGGGGHAKVIISIIKRFGLFSIIGYLDSVDKGNILDVGYIGSDNDILNGKYNNVCNNLAMGIGVANLKNCNKRKKIMNVFRKEGFIFPNIISKSSIISDDVKLQEGIVIMDGAIINSGTRIRSLAIINTGAIIDHDCYIDESSHIAPGVTLSGNVSIGKNSIIGAGSTIKQSINICPNTFVGAGAVVVRNINKKGTYVGVPAKDHNE
tara:strand:- start:60 stop:701 length:642 start_codon:yes stop_codon:yes gene_type:complete